MFSTPAERSLRIINDDGSMESVQAQVLSWPLGLITSNVVLVLILSSPMALSFSSDYSPSVSLVLKFLWQSAIPFPRGLDPFIGHYLNFPLGRHDQHLCQEEWLEHINRLGSDLPWTPYHRLYLLPPHSNIDFGVQRSHWKATLGMLSMPMRVITVPFQTQGFGSLPCPLSVYRCALK